MQQCFVQRCRVQHVSKPAQAAQQSREWSGGLRAGGGLRSQSAVRGRGAGGGAAAGGGAGGVGAAGRIPRGGRRGPAGGRRVIGRAVPGGGRRRSQGPRLGRPQPPVHPGVPPTKYI